MNGPRPTLTAAEVAARIDGKVFGNAELELNGFAPADRAQPGDLTFAENENYLARAEQSAASAVIVDRQAVSSSKTLILVPSARIAFAKVLPLFFPEPVYHGGIHPSAIVDDSAEIGEGAHVGPHCYVGARARIGARSVLQGGNHVAPRCVLGEDVHMFPNAVLYEGTEIGNRVRIHAGAVIGADGFGYVLDGGSHRKVPQIGNVIIKDDVEIGANATIDRGALGPTVIGKGTKIDNLVQIGHNVVMGEHCLLVAQVGVAGSSKLGSYVVLAGQVGIAGHLKLGSGVSIGGQSGVMHNISDGEKWLGSPALPERQAKRILISLQQLPDLIRKVAELENRLSSCGSPPTPRTGT